MHHANDNQPRTPAEHRATVVAQATEGERNYQSGSWPQGRRLHKAGKLVLATGLVGWQTLNAMPRLSAANDNHAVKSYSVETTGKDILSGDDIVAAVEAEKREPGKHYREDTQEIFVVTKRDPEGKPIEGGWRPIVGETGSERHHSAAAPDWSIDPEDEETKMARLIDCKRVRARLGPAVCTVLDMAAGDATTGEIAAAIGCSRAKAEAYVDMAIQKYLSIAA